MRLTLGLLMSHLTLRNKARDEFTVAFASPLMKRPAVFKKRIEYITDGNLVMVEPIASKKLIQFPMRHVVQCPSEFLRGHPVLCMRISMEEPPTAGHLQLDAFAVRMAKREASFAPAGRIESEAEEVFAA